MDAFFQGHVRIPDDECLQPPVCAPVRPSRPPVSSITEGVPALFTAPRMNTFVVSSSSADSDAGTVFMVVRQGSAAPPEEPEAVGKEERPTAYAPMPEALGY